MLIPYLHMILRICWGVVFLGAFFLLPPAWALFAAIFVGWISPFAILICYIPLKEALVHRPRISALVSGGLEALVLLGAYWLIMVKIGAPPKLLPVMGFEYSINQLNRVWRNPKGPADLQELAEMVGFALTFLSMAAIARWRNIL